MGYLYYRLWQVLNKSKTNDTPAINALLLISLSQMLNLLAAYFFISLVADVELRVFPKSTLYLFSAAIGGIILLINYFVLYKKRAILLEKYKNESKQRQITGRIVVELYIVSSLFITIFLAAKGSI